VAEVVVIPIADDLVTGVGKVQYINVVICNRLLRKPPIMQVESEGLPCHEARTTLAVMNILPPVTRPNRFLPSISTLAFRLSSVAG
jgi:hypothetical protein